MKYAKLVGKEVVPLPDTEDAVLEWAKSFSDKSRFIASDYYGDAHVSTVFLGIDHSFFREKPEWFETMIFGGPHDGYQDRYGTYDDAIDGHALALKIVCGEADEI